MDNLEQLRETISMTFGVPIESVTQETTQEDVEGWDSVGHLNLMLMLEERFGVRLEIEDMERLTSVAAILAHLD